jgi:hypothetical protein
MNPDQKEIDRLWRHVGLEALRERLSEVEKSAAHFERALRALPTCDKCARLSLFEHIEQTGKRLGSQVISLTALTETLKSTVDTAEKLAAKLSQEVPGPCRCAEEECTCQHD